MSKKVKLEPDFTVRVQKNGRSKEVTLADVVEAGGGGSQVVEMDADPDGSDDYPFMTQAWVESTLTMWLKRRSGWSELYTLPS